MSVGLILLMLAVDIHWFIFPGIVFFTSGSFALLVTNYALSQLFPSATGVIMALGRRFLIDFFYSRYKFLNLLLSYSQQ